MVRENTVTPVRRPTAWMLSLALAPAMATAQEKPYVVLDFDATGSMAWDLCGSGGMFSPTEVEASAECPGVDVTCLDCNASGCDNGVSDDSRLWRIRTATADAVNTHDNVVYGLVRTHKDPAAFVCPYGAWAGSCAPGDVLEPLVDGNQADVLEWMDTCDNWPTAADCDPAVNVAPDAGCSLCTDCGTSCDKELRPSGQSPVADSLFAARNYLAGVRTGDPQAACRPYAVVLLSESAEDTCGGDAPAEAAALCAEGIPTYVVGLDMPTFLPTLDAIAQAGCAPTCSRTGCDGLARVSNDPSKLSAAIGAILDAQAAAMVEVCNGRDDDCNGMTDDASPPCALEFCNGNDDNMNGMTDEPPLADSGLPCGTDEGECAAGVTCCSAGVPCCTDVGPLPESCDCLDNDCDALTDQGAGCSCGDGCCSGGETACTCPADCPAVASDGCCTPPEDCAAVPADCGPCPEPPPDLGSGAELAGGDGAFDGASGSPDGDGEPALEGGVVGDARVDATPREDGGGQLDSGSLAPGARDGGCACVLARARPDRGAAPPLLVLLAARALRRRRRM